MVFFENTKSINAPKQHNNCACLEALIFLACA